jgi:UDP-N-acetyl-D-mannosaminuronic acid dehydrogenase
MQEALERTIGASSLTATDDPNVLTGCNVVICAIGTGVSDDGIPDLSQIEELVEFLSPHCNVGDLLLLKTTLPIGTTRKISEALSSRSGLILDEELMVAFSPERIVEGRAMEELRTLPKIVGGIGEKSSNRASEIVSKMGGRTILVSDSETAELCKLLDNSYRMTRFGFSSDVAAVAWRNGVDAYEAIKAANLDYPRNNIPLPSVGVSGYCLTKDPYYLDSGAANLWVDRGFPSTWIAARMAADHQITEAVSRIEGHLRDLPGKPRVVIAGITYKEDIDDIRLSHGREIARKMVEMDWDVFFWDPVTSENLVDGISVSSENSCIHGADCIIFTVPHREFIAWSHEFSGIDEMRTKLVFDGWGIVKAAPDGVILTGTGRTD